MTNDDVAAIDDDYDDDERTYTCLNFISLSLHRRTPILYNIHLSFSYDILLYGSQVQSSRFVAKASNFDLSAKPVIFACITRCIIM